MHRAHLWVVIPLLAVLACGGPSGAPAAPPGTTPPKPDSIVRSLDVGGAASVRVNKTIQLVATPRNASGEPVAVAVIDWRSQNPAVASVTSVGTVTGVAVGTTRIEALVNGLTGGIDVTVLSPTAVRVSVGAAGYVGWMPSFALAVGDSAQLVAQAFDDVGNVILNPVVQWSVKSNDGTPLEVSPEGRVTGLTPGRADVVAAVDDATAFAHARVAVRDARFVDVFLGGLNVCGVTPDKDIYCWGRAVAIGNGLHADSAVPVPIAGEQAFESLSIGTDLNSTQACGIAVERGRYCWGMLGRERDGLAEFYTAVAPVGMSDPASFVTIALGDRHGCALTSEGVAYCWGDNARRQLGDGSQAMGNRYFEPRVVAGDARFVALSAAWDMTCGLTAAGEAYCWGYRVADNFSSNVPVRVADGHDFSAISVGSSHTCGLKADGSAWCWGNRPSFMDPNAVADQYGCDANSVCKVSGAHVFREVAVGSSVTCGVRTDGVALCWGSANGYGSLGTGDNVAHYEPTSIGGDIRFQKLRVSHLSACGLDVGGTVYCWGWNKFGNLGDGSSTDRNVPTKVLRQL